MASNPERSDVISVRSVKRLGGGLVEVAIRLPDDTLRKFVMPTRLSTFDNVTFCAAAVAGLVVIAGKSE